MNKDRWKLITNIVDEVLKTNNPSAKKKILEDRCGNDPDLKSEVRKFLDSIENSSDYWDSLFQSNRLFIGEITDNYKMSTDDSLLDKTATLPEIDDTIPDQIGLYKIKKRVGYGGMGEVFLAGRCDEKFNQNVALKLMRHGVTSKNQARRFEQERTILSSLNHPNIARLLDGGISVDGRSYYVMEYVDGIPITEYCKKNNCDLDERLNLFKQVCRAVQYAHSNFIVHRDLKPENLLVNKQGVVKILDFGIAKMIDDSLDEQAILQTSSGFRMLSLKYAAPEQITLDPITTATDVYSLGILLFELLTGFHPFDLKNKSLHETEYIIRHREPSKPSSVSNRWSTQLKGDLDAIILKALRKESTERYDSAQNMLDDIERFEKSLPVSARHDSLIYRSKKFIKRHSLSLMFIGFILLMVTAFTLFYTQRISEEKQFAELQAQKAEQVTLFLMDLFEANNPLHSEGEVLTARDMLERGEADAEKLEGYPELKAQMFEVMGEIYRRLGQYDKSESLLRQSLTIRQDVYGNYHSETVGTFDKLGLLLINKGEFFAADSLLSLALSIRENHLKSAGPDLAETLSNLAYARRRVGNNTNAEQLYRRSLEIRDKHLGRDHPLTIENMNSLGVVLHYKAKYRETEALFREILQRRENLLAPVHPDIAISQNSLGALLMNLGDFREADSLLNRALTVRRKLYGDNHPFVALTLNNLAISHMDQGRLSEAEKYVNEAYRIRKEQLGHNHTNTALTKFTIAKLMLETNRPDSALKLYKEAYNTFHDNLSPGHSLTARTMVGIGSAYLAKNDLENARFYFEEGYQKVEAVHSEESLEHALASIQYGAYLMKTGEEERANEILNTAHKTLQEIEHQESLRQENIMTLLNQNN
ncbi:MAG: serine/threonine-protein kinase [Balneolaceae bacterium]|nr:serine/threonine-protein kinase [Balneolaceae bacterium]